MGELVQKNNYNYIGLPIGRQNVNSTQIRTGQEIYEAVCQMADYYQYEIEQRNGQRFFGPPKNALFTPAKECEIFVGSIPREVYEDVLIPVLKTVKGLHLFRLMMDFSGNNRGFGFALYSTPEQAKDAVRLLDKYEILPGKFLAVLTCHDNNILYMGGLEHRNPHEIIAIIMGKTPNAQNVQVTFPDKKGKRYVVIRYPNHREAALARRYYLVANYELWHPRSQIIVDWSSRHFLKEQVEVYGSVSDSGKLFFHYINH